MMDTLSVLEFRKLLTWSCHNLRFRRSMKERKREVYSTSTKMGVLKCCMDKVLKGSETWVHQKCVDAISDLTLGKCSTGNAAVLCCKT